MNGVTWSLLELLIAAKNLRQFISQIGLLDFVSNCFRFWTQMSLRLIIPINNKNIHHPVFEYIFSKIKYVWPTGCQAIGLQSYHSFPEIQFCNLAVEPSIERIKNIKNVLVSRFQSVKCVVRLPDPKNMNSHKSDSNKSNPSSRKRKQRIQRI